MLARRNTFDYSESFKTKPGDINLKDKQYPTKLECELVRKKLGENLMRIPCTDERLDSMKWGALVVKEDKYKKHRVKSINKKIKKKALLEAKDAASQAAKDKEEEDTSEELTEDSEEVKAIWEKQLINEKSLQAQLPTFENPGQ